ncbi:AAA family ATPase, partial [Acinetobacter baumannii]|nr:AAA family ATPase [Acinetobacter baumannii]EKW1172586.1 AAA family ATPase [Acinetobacter baumannii]
SKLKSIRIENIRSLMDTSDIQLKPLTVLVGRNSVGKSTFARIFPLLRQSSEANKKSPILWYGKYVDFGDYETAINKENINNGIALSFNLSIEPLELIGIFDFDYSIRGNLSYTIFKKLSNKKIDSKINLFFKKNEDESYDYKINLIFLDYNISVIFNKNKVTTSINNMTYNLSEEDLINITQKNILPNFEVNFDNKKKPFSQKFSYFHYKNFLYLDLIKNHTNISHEIQNENEFYNQMLTKSAYDFIYKIDKKIKKELSPPSFNINIEDSVIYENIFLISKLPEIIDYFDTIISNYFKNVQYLEPLRAKAQRYYRKQELAIDEVDSKGSNIAMFLVEHNNNPTLKNLIRKHFDLKFITESNKGHITLNLLSNKDEKTNLADLGVGYSQLLPVILQLWNAIHGHKNDKNGCLVVEQPELHLHPAYQAKISDITVDIINQLKDLDRNYNFIYETHSPHLINRLGELIEEGIFDHNDVQILIFDNENGKTNIIHSKFNNEGILENWPFGFFN